MTCQHYWQSNNHNFRNQKAQLKQKKKKEKKIIQTKLFILNGTNSNYEIIIKIKIKHNFYWLDQYED